MAKNNEETKPARTRKVANRAFGVWLSRAASTALLNAAAGEELTDIEEALVGELIGSERSVSFVMIDTSVSFSTEEYARSKKDESATPYETAAGEILREFPNTATSAIVFAPSRSETNDSLAEQEAARQQTVTQLTALLQQFNGDMSRVLDALGVPASAYNAMVPAPAE